VFATLLSALPRPDGQGAGKDASPDDIERLIEVAVRAQEEAGLEPVTDGRLRARAFDEIPTPMAAVEQWRATQSLTEQAAKQALPGPCSSSVELAALVEVVNALAEAGCPLVEIEETGIEQLADQGERDEFRRAHELLLERASGTHLSLSIVGGAPDQNAWESVLGLGYASLALDLINGPESWNLVTRWAGERGVVAGVESGRAADEPKEVLLWAAHYAASTQHRGLERVGLGSAGSWANLTWAAAVRKMRLLGEAARLASMPPGEDLYRSLDPRAVSPRRAAMGHDG
jgi:methionine synthase II (cobalamin-independent)